MNAHKIELPAHWASYLINGDATGLDDGEDKKIDALLYDKLPKDATIVDVGDNIRFTWHYHLYDGGLSGARGGSVVEYTYLTQYH